MEDEVAKHRGPGQTRNAPHPVLEITDQNHEPPAKYLWNKAEERSLPNILPPDFMRIVDRVIQTDPQLFHPDERVLRNRLSEARRRPTPTTNRLRMKFWHEYDMAQAEKRTIRLSNVYNGVCFHENFYEFCRDIYSLAWILCPPANYIVVMEEALTYGIEQLRDILDDPIIDPKTQKYNTTLADIKLKIVTMLDQRVKGAVVQKIEQTSKNLSVGVQIKASEAKVMELAQRFTSDELEQKLKDLEAKRSQHLVKVDPT